jgi:hypothetical protein
MMVFVKFPTALIIDACPSGREDAGVPSVLTRALESFPASALSVDALAGVRSAAPYECDI